ncbi:MAG: fasciclin domain-containing protein, partial [Candidatus Bathyarchaeota archaeon]
LTSIQTLQGDNISITVGPPVMVDGANITVVDIECTNGIIHVIDAVMRASTDSTPPAISEVLHDPEIPDDSEIVTVTANITDTESGVYHVVLSYTSDGGTWTNITMVNTSGDTYEGEIPGFPAETEVQYQIIAYDNIGNAIIENNAGAYYIYSVIPEFSATMLLTVFMILSLLATFIIKKRKTI